jgi:hypothetical protein
VLGTIYHPLTGAEVSALPTNPVFVVKIDNTRPAAPQVHLDKADLVIEETVEGGVTRLAALYYSRLPKRVGHIRSMRATDIGIAKPVNAHVVASGGAGPTIKRIKNAHIRIFSQDQGDDGFWRDTSRRAPYNVNVNLAKINRAAKQTTPRRPYLPWAKDLQTPTAPTQPAGWANVRFSSFHMTTWEFHEGLWKRSNGNAGDHEFGATTMAVLFADEKDAGYLDPGGNRVPETIFKGTGRAVVFIGRAVVEGTWTKPTLNSTISLTDAAGTPILLPAGPTWIELVTKAHGSVKY